MNHGRVLLVQEAGMINCGGTSIDISHQIKERPRSNAGPFLLEKQPECHSEIHLESRPMMEEGKLR
jgi:hypothetical protein